MLTRAFCRERPKNVNARQIERPLPEENTR